MKKTVKKKRERRLPNYSLGVRYVLVRDHRAVCGFYLRTEQMTPDEIKAHNKAIN